MTLTSDDLVTAVKRRASWPTTNAPLSDTEILAVADEEIAGELYPRIIQAHADYYITTYDQSIVSGTDAYLTPKQAYGPLKDVTVVDSNNNEFSVALVDVEELGQGIWSQRYYGQFLGGGLSYSMFFQGDVLYLRPVPSVTSYTLRIRYYCQPNKLVALASGAKITNRAIATNDVLTMDTNQASNWGGTASVDIIGGGNAHALRDVNRSATIGSSTATIAVASGGWATLVAIGDYIALTGYTPIVQLPDFFIPAAIRQIAAACLEANKETASAADEYAVAAEQMDRALKTAIPRVEGEPQVVATNNSPFRSARVSRFGGRW